METIKEKAWLNFIESLSNQIREEGWKARPAEKGSIFIAIDWNKKYLKVPVELTNTEGSEPVLGAMLALTFGIVKCGDLPAAHFWAGQYMKGVLGIVPDVLNECFQLVKWQQSNAE